MEIVINKCYGGFGLSELALRRLDELGADVRTPVAKYYGKTGAALKAAIEEAKERNNVSSIFSTHFTEDFKYVISFDSGSEIKRSDPLLVQVVKELGAKANDPFADLKIVEVPDGCSFEIGEYDGVEHIAETHRTWG